MRRFVFILLLLLLSCALSACTGSPWEQEGGYLTKKQVLKQDSNADLLEYDGKVYKTNIDWTEVEKLTKGDKLGVVSRGMATHIPDGAEIFASNERDDVLIVDYMQVEKRYLLQIGE
ncbi:hypothetical protein CSV75_02100 [Sporosarcina sp. P18a]|uniref:hypothetical protein n=1 Tax=Sporosarcina sp. P18a TaxID=2048259 RepID=UPI000C167233|nr:hypothetical protein [Sporosarcina sp. P18a]PIC80606.1 hypothetical protein CSV75_02100 [Sporosarcina sp. P18a]